VLQERQRTWHDDVGRQPNTASGAELLLHSSRSDQALIPQLAAILLIIVLQHRRQVLEKASEGIFVPLTVGGGIRSFTDSNGTAYSALEVASEYFRCSRSSDHSCR